MNRTLVILLVFVMVAGGLLFGLRKPLVMALMRRRVTQNLRVPRMDRLPDGLHIGLCGAGSPLPDPDRSGPCVAVVAGGKLYIVDAGAGSSRVLARMQLPPGRVEAVFLTHFHSDHIDGLGEILLQRWAGQVHDSATPVYGPPGVEKVVEGFNLAYAQDFAYRVVHHGEAVVPRSGAGGEARPFAVPAEGEGPIILHKGGLTVTAFVVDHAPVKPAVGYRFDYKDRSAVISGDTVKSTNLIHFARGVDLLVHEALSPKLVGVVHQAASDVGASNLEKITSDILQYHSTPIEAAEVARDAGVGYLLLYHIVPPLPLAPLEEIFLEGVDEVYPGALTIGRDGTFIQLETGSKEIRLENLL